MGLRERLFGSTTIVMDSDGVFVDLVEIVLLKVNKRMGTSLAREDVTSWGWIGENVPELVQAARLAIKAGVENPRGLGIELEANWYKRENMRIALPDPVVMRVVRDCRVLGFNLIFTTSRLPIFEEVSREWYREHLPWADAERRLFIRPGVLLGMDGNEYKMGVAWLHQAGVFFDDHAPTVWRSRMVGIPAFLVHQPWNQEDGYIPDQWRVKRNYFDMMSVIFKACITEQLSRRR
jgi:hypothetical protein